MKRKKVLVKMGIVKMREKQEMPDLIATSCHHHPSLTEVCIEPPSFYPIKVVTLIHM